MIDSLKDVGFSFIPATGISDEVRNTLIANPLRKLGTLKTVVNSSYSVVIVVLRKQPAPHSYLVSDLVATGSTEVSCVFSAESAFRSGDVLLLCDAVINKGPSLDVKSKEQIIKLGECDSLSLCDGQGCRKPTVISRDGPFCWQHSINASLAVNVRANIRGGVLAMVKEKPVAPPAEEKKRKALEIGVTHLEARKRTALWLQERNSVRTRSIHSFSYAVMAGGGVETANNADDLEIEMDDREITRIHLPVAKPKTAPVQAAVAAEDPKTPPRKVKRKEPIEGDFPEIPHAVRENIKSVPSMFAAAIEKDRLSKLASEKN